MNLFFTRLVDIKCLGQPQIYATVSKALINKVLSDSVLDFYK